MSKIFFFCADKGEFRDRVGLRISLRPFSGLLTAKPARTANSCGIPKSATMRNCEIQKMAKKSFFHSLTTVLLLPERERFGIYSRHKKTAPRPFIKRPMAPGSMFLNSSLARVITHVLARVFLHVLARALLHVLAHSSQQFGLARVFLHVLARVLLHVHVQCANLTRCKIVQRVQ